MPQRARSRQSHLKDCRKPSKPQFVGERETVRLSEIAKIKAGNVAPKKDAFTEDGIPFVRAGSLTNLLAGLGRVVVRGRVRSDLFEARYFPEVDDAGL